MKEVILFTHLSTDRTVTPGEVCVLWCSPVRWEGRAGVLASTCMMTRYKLLGYMQFINWKLLPYGLWTTDLPNIYLLDYLPPPPHPQPFCPPPTYAFFLSLVKLPTRQVFCLIPYDHDDSVHLDCVANHPCRIIKKNSVQCPGTWWIKLLLFEQTFGLLCVVLYTWFM